MSIAKKRAPRFRVGDPVRFLYGTEKVAGEILEDRGPLGEYGRRLYRVRINAGRDDESSFEIPEEDIERRELGTNSDETPGLRQEFTVTYVRRTASRCQTEFLVYSCIGVGVVVQWDHGSTLANPIR
jgi:hypothetical protein